MLVSVKQTTANIWRLHDMGYFVVVPTNLYVKSDRKAVFGRGIAEQAATSWPDVTSFYGECLLSFVRPGLAPGKQPKMADLDEFALIQADLERKLVFFPTKLTWGENSNPELIEKSFVSLKRWLKGHPGVSGLAIPRVGAGNGHLDWNEVVKPLMRAFLESLDERTRAKLVIVHPVEYLRSMQVE
jgi:hypothetical protein